MNTTNTKNLIDTYSVVFNKAEERMQKAKTAEEKAFYFGHMNLAAAFGAALIRALDDDSNNVKVMITWNYEDALKEYNESNEKYNKDQISMEDIVPEIFAGLEKIIDATVKKHCAQSKPATKTTKSKKE